MIKGMELSRAYFYEICFPVLEKEFSSYLPRMAAGLIGEGSECYGYDDAISRDHDFGPGFQIFIPKEDMAVYGDALASRLEQLPKEYKGFQREESLYGGGRLGIFSVEDFYKKYIAVEDVPSSLSIWRQIPEHALSTVTNGTVFFDHYGAFTRIREELKKGYPEDIRLKKMSARLMTMAQSGQYNFPRCLKRKEYVAASLALAEFQKALLSFLYLLNHSYCPYYKWSHHGLFALPLLGKEIAEKLNRLTALSMETQGKEMVWLIEEMAGQIVAVLKRQQLTRLSEPFLLAQGPEVIKRISDPALRNSNPWVE